MHIPHSNPPFTGAIAQFTNPQRATGRNPPGPKNRRVEDTGRAAGAPSGHRPFSFTTKAFLSVSSTLTVI